MRNTIESLPFERVDTDSVQLTITLEPLESVLLVFQLESRPLPRRLDPQSSPRNTPITVTRLETPPDLIIPNRPPTPSQVDAPQELVKAGNGPWGDLDDGRELTPSPVKSDPFVGRFVLPADWLDDNTRICVVADQIVPETAAAITVNGQPAGGFIGKPCRLDITSWVSSGENRIALEPFAPRSVQIVAYPNLDSDR